MDKEVLQEIEEEEVVQMEREIDEDLNLVGDKKMHKDQVAGIGKEMPVNMYGKKSARKVALLTGAASGIGAATALLLAKQGYDLLINYRSSQAAAEATRERCLAASASVMLGQGDVSDDAVCRQLAAQALQTWGRIDLLVNNAGRTVFTGLQNWDLLTAEQFNSIYAVNALAAFQMVRACLPALRESAGSIVNVSSAAGVLGRGSSVPYLMSKGALNALTLYLARSLAPVVRVNAVCPGFVTTCWFRHGLGEEGYERLRQRYKNQVPLACVNTPEDVAAAIFWLARDARTMTGELLLLDSGLHLGTESCLSPVVGA
jgi:3-oxoacyl-[acyl-carrier protein] reductase